MIASRRISGNKEARDDLLSGLLDACEGDFDGFSKLSDRELLGTFTNKTDYGIANFLNIHICRKYLHFPHCRWVSLIYNSALDTDDIMPGHEVG